MKLTISLKRLIDWRVIVFCAVASFSSVGVQAQSAEVHISLRANPATTGSPPGAVTSGSSPAVGRTSTPLRVEVNLVLVPVTVSDSLNRSVISLEKQDFSLYEENKLQEIRYFTIASEPASVAILLDVSKSMTDKIETERAAIVEFFKNAHPDDEYFAIVFSDRPRLLAGPTESIDVTQQKLMTVEPGGPTAMLDAVYLGVSELRAARYKRKAIVIVSDGGDNASRYSLREIKSLVRESDVQIYAIGLFETFFVNAIEERLGREWLSEITDVTGGRTITVDKRAKLPEAAATISREMRNQYVLGYRPPGLSTDKWRRIKVRVKSSSESQPLRAYYKEGYYSTH
jgi:Ca-activated chloride channel family protein